MMCFRWVLAMALLVAAMWSFGCDDGDDGDGDADTDSDVDGDGDADTDGDADGDGDSDVDGDGDGDGDVDGDADGDGDADADSDSDAGISVPNNADSVGTGTRRTITIDGENTGDEWGSDTLLITDPAADDARFLGSNWCAHEAPWDYAALHGAWDDANLYIGIQFVNVTDVLDPSNLGSSEGSQIHGMDLIQFVVIDTSSSGGYSTGGDMWDKDHEFIGDNQPDYQVYFHSNFSQEGTYIGSWDGASLTPFAHGHDEPDLVGAGGELYVGATLMGVDPHGDDSSPGDYGGESSAYIGERGHSTAYDTFFELQIPLALIGLTASDLDGGVIGIFAANGDGSAVDSIPDDPATSDTPGTSDSNSPLEWSMVDDDDQYSVPFAWIGAPRG